MGFPANGKPCNCTGQCQPGYVPTIPPPNTTWPQPGTNPWQPQAPKPAPPPFQTVVIQPTIDYERVREIVREELERAKEGK